nr:hypothetical protein Itr_chr13CG19860 [Ipomoea trifida]
MSSAFPMWLPRELLSSSSLLLLHTPHMPAMWWSVSKMLPSLLLSFIKHHPLHIQFIPKSTIVFLAFKSSSSKLNHFPVFSLSEQQKRMATVLKIALDDGGYEYNAPAASLEGDDDDDGGYDYAPAA